MRKEVRQNGFSAAKPGRPLKDHSWGWAWGSNELDSLTLTICQWLIVLKRCVTGFASSMSDSDGWHCGQCRRLIPVESLPRSLSDSRPVGRLSRHLRRIVCSGTPVESGVSPDRELTHWRHAESVADFSVCSHNLNDRLELST